MMAAEGRGPEQFRTDLPKPGYKRYFFLRAATVAVTVARAATVAVAFDAAFDAAFDVDPR
jgi:hypothetical protein